MCLKPIEVDCQTWTWGDVKEVQDAIALNLTYMNILLIAQMDCKNLKDCSPAHVVFSAFLGVRNSINEISKKESEQWARPLEPKQQQALAAVGGFEMFGTLPQTLRLAEIMKLSYNEVLKIEWITGFNAYTYDVQCNEYNKLILK